MSLSLFSSNPNYSEYQKIFGHILSHLDQPSQGALGCADKGSNQHLETFRSQQVVELFKKAISNVTSIQKALFTTVFPIDQLPTEIFLRVLGFLGQQGRGRTSQVCQEWTVSIGRLLLDEEHSKVRERFSSLWETLELLKKHLLSQPKISLERQKFISETLDAIAPGKTDATTLPEMMTLEHDKQVKIVEFLKELSPEEFDLFLQFSEFRTDTNVGKFLNFIIKCIPAIRTTFALADDLEAFHAILDSNIIPYFQTDEEEPYIAKRLQERACVVASEMNAEQAVQLATLYSEIIPETCPEKPMALWRISLRLINNGCIEAGFEIIKLCSKTVSKECREKANALEGMGSCIIDQIFNDDYDTAQLSRDYGIVAQTAILCAETVSEIPRRKDAILFLCNKLIFYFREAEVLEIVKRCCELGSKGDLPEWIDILEELIGYATSQSRDLGHDINDLAATWITDDATKQRIKDAMYSAMRN